VISPAILYSPDNPLLRQYLTKTMQLSNVTQFLSHSHISHALNLAWYTAKAQKHGLSNPCPKILFKRNINV